MSLTDLFLSLLMLRARIAGMATSRPIISAELVLSRDSWIQIFLSLPARPLTSDPAQSQVLGRTPYLAHACPTELLQYLIPAWPFLYQLSWTGSHR